MRPPPRIENHGMLIDREPGGVIRARSPVPLGPYPLRLTDRLDHWAEHAPTRTFLGDRETAGDRWRLVTYAEARTRARAIAQAILDRRLSADRPIVILSGNSLEHALLTFGAMYAGVAVAPVSPAYALADRTLGLLGRIWKTLTPGLVFAAEGDPFAPAIDKLAAADTEVVTLTGRLTTREVTPFAALESPEPVGVDAARDRITGSTPAKFMFTSGSTGLPKGVINTHENLSANQAQLLAVLAFLEDEPAVLCDWLPWHHTFGGNHNLGLVLYNGGTLFIDRGRPVPGAAFDLTLANLRDTTPTFYLNVPRGYDLLAGALRRDMDLRERFFGRVRAMFCGAASIKGAVATEMRALAASTRQTAVPWVTGLGATESSPFAICTGVAADVTVQHIGVPVPGIEVRLVPTDGLLEARLRGPNITPGYWRDDDQTRVAFDEEGFYRLGDAMRPVDPEDPARGLVFEGRIGENFKLSSGTWVRVSPLRDALLRRLGDLARDVVIGAPDRDELVALVSPNIEACRALAGARSDQSDQVVLDSQPVREAFALALRDMLRGGHGATTRLTRLGVLAAPPSLSSGEMTDKGSLNQRAILSRRAALVDALYGAGEGSVLVG